MPLGIPNFVSNLFSGLKKGGSNTNSSSNPNPNTSSETEKTMEEPMEVDPLDTSNTIPNNDDPSSGSKTVMRTSGAVEKEKNDNNQEEDKISIKTEANIKQDVEEMETSTDTPNTHVLPDSLEVVKIIKLDASLAAGITDGNQIILTEDVLGDLPAGISVDGEAVVVVLPPEGDEDDQGMIQVAEILPTSGVTDADNDEFPIINSETAANVEVLDVIETEVTEEAEVEVCSESVTEPGATLLGAVSGPDLDEKEIGEEATQEEFGDENDAESFVEITRRRISQDRDGNCYCGKDRNLNIAELLCASCNRWYHESCIGYQLGKLVPFMANYVFICKNCSPTGLESFKRNQAQFTQMCVTALANLTQASAKDGTNRKIFSKDKDIIPFFDMHWEGMTTTTRRVTQSWHSTVSKALQKEVGTAFVSEESLNDPDSPYFGLMCSDLTQIRPNYDAMIKGGHLKVTELGVHQSSNSIFRGRGAKRRTVGGDPVVLSQASVAKKTRGDSFLPKMILGHGYPVDHPYNKDGYRYILAEPDSNAPYRQEFDESSDWAGKPIPGWLYRVLNPCSVLLALHDRAPQLKVSEDRLSVTGEKGYCMIRATHGVTKGCWYWEAKITDMPEGSHTRIGFSQPYGNLQGPLGYDRYGYSWRSRYGTKFHEAKGKSYCKGGYGLGDTLGFLIEMPETNPTAPSVPQSFKDRPLVRFKSHLYYEDKDDKAQESEPLTIRKESKIICFKNGVCQGIAYQDMNEGIYYPAVSLFKGVTVNVNFGPDFWAEPDKNIYHHKGMYERSDDAIVQQTVSDLVFLTENHGKLRLENAVALPQ